MPICEIGVSILSLTADTAQISVSSDSFGPTVARLKRKYPFAAETNSDRQGWQPGLRQMANRPLPIRLP